MMMEEDSRTHSIVIAGDLLPSTKNLTLFEKGDAVTIFGDKVFQLFSKADFSIVNLEGALTDGTEKQIKTGPVLKASKSSVNGLKSLNVSAIALANNHIMDYGEVGYVDTINSIEASGMQHVGSGNGIDEIKTHLSLVIAGKKICIYNVSESFYNIPDICHAGCNLYDEWIVCNEIKSLKEKHDYVFVIYHGGSEYFPYPTPMVRRRFHRMADCGADFVTAQHTHCIGCEEYYNGAYLLYGQGNFLFARQYTKGRMVREGLLLEVLIDNQLTVKKHYVCVNEDDVLGNFDMWDSSEFEERSNNVNNDKLIEEEYGKLEFQEIKNKFLLSFKGAFPFRNVFLKYFPQWYKNKISKTYSREQIMTNMTVNTQERRQEDVLYLWKYIMENHEK